MTTTASRTEVNSPSSLTDKALAPKKDLKVLSLFSGCGGMDLGFEGDFFVKDNSVNSDIHPEWVTKKRKGWSKLKPTRFKTIFANDIRPGAEKAWRQYFPDTYKLDADDFHLESIVDRVKRYWDGDKSAFPDKVDVVTGGFPCQDFSVAGKRQGFESKKSHSGKALDDAPTSENRGQLYTWMREVIDITQPKVFIAENVKGLVSLGDVKKIIQKDFEKIGDDGYIVLDAQVLHAANFGVPQSRQRVFFIGLKRSALKKSAIKALEDIANNPDLTPYPTPTHSKIEEAGLLPYVTLRDVFKDLEEPEVSKDNDQQAYSKAKWYGNHCQGNKEVSLDKIGPTIRSEHHGNIEFRRLSSPHGGKNTTELKDGMQERRLTIRECCRVQTFPDSYKFLGAKRGEGVGASESYKLIGNAVPPLLAYHLAARLEVIWPTIFKK